MNAAFRYLIPKRKLRFFFLILILVQLLIFREIQELSDDSMTKEKKPKGCIIVTLKNEDLLQFVKTLKQFELYFNHKHNYPYIFFNNHDFNETFRNEIVKHTNSNVEFVTISKERWSLPEWIDRNRFKQSLQNIGFKESYRHMCRFYSGFFFREKATLKYDYYIRLDRDSEFHCPFKEDPFMRFELDRSLMYGFAIGGFESLFTIPTLWSTIKTWMKTVRDELPSEKESFLKFISSNNGISLTNYCMFYNNFEIARFSMFRSKNYLSYFEALDKAGGFFYERWGDAPVHSYYVTVMMKKSQVRLFSDIAYKHQYTSNFIKSNATCVSNLDRNNLLSIKIYIFER